MTGGGMPGYPSLSGCAGWAGHRPGEQEGFLLVRPSPDVRYEDHALEPIRADERTAPRAEARVSEGTPAREGVEWRCGWCPSGTPRVWGKRRVSHGLCRSCLAGLQPRTTGAGR